MWYNEWVIDAIKILFVILFFILLIFGIGYLLHTNINFAYYISDELEIPRDLSLTIMSAGFANNIIILLSVFEFAIGFWLVYKIANTTLFQNVKDFVINLWVIMIQYRFYVVKCII